MWDQTSMARWDHWRDYMHVEIDNHFCWERITKCKMWENNNSTYIWSKKIPLAVITSKSFTWFLNLLNLAFQKAWKMLVINSFYIKEVFKMIFHSTKHQIFDSISSAEIVVVLHALKLRVYTIIFQAILVIAEVCLCIELHNVINRFILGNFYGILS